MKKNLFILIIFLLTLTFGYTQTNVSGGIYSNTTWTLANSPYIVVDTIVIFPGVTLTIQPGVIVKFDNDIIIEARQSSIIAEGTSADSIIFTSSSLSPSMGIWGGLHLNESTYSKFNHCHFSYADKAIYPDFMNGDTITCYNSTFVNNTIGIGWVYYATLLVDSCLFSNNSNGIKWATTWRAVVTNSSFLNNQNGIYNLENLTIRKCNFEFNTGIALSYAQDDSIVNCTFTNNDTALIEAYAGAGIAYLVTDNIIENNNFGLIIYDGSRITCNKICNNAMFNTKMQGTTNTILENNYWCSNDSATIANTIYDGYDNFSLGLIDFNPFDTTQCYLTTGIAKPILSNKNSIKIYPNPFKESTTLSFDNLKKEKHNLSVYNSIGQVILSINSITTGEVKIERTNLTNGLYFFQLRTESQIVGAGKIIIE
jgi:hypothetical protein